MSTAPRRAGDGRRSRTPNTSSASNSDCVDRARNPWLHPSPQPGSFLEEGAPRRETIQDISRSTWGQVERQFIDVIVELERTANVLRQESKCERRKRAGSQDRWQRILINGEA